ncbi:hypothetical protein ACTWWB_003692 [Vibrio fluvialis]
MNKQDNILLTSKFITLNNPRSQAVFVVNEVLEGQFTVEVYNFVKDDLQNFMTTYDKELKALGKWEFLLHV